MAHSEGWRAVLHGQINNVHSSTTIHRECVADGEDVVTVSMGEAKCMKASSDEFGIKNIFFHSRNVARHALGGVATCPLKGASILWPHSAAMEAVL